MMNLCARLDMLDERTTFSPRKKDNRLWNRKHPKPGDFVPLIASFHKIPNANGLWREFDFRMDDFPNHADLLAWNGYGNRHLLL